MKILSASDLRKCVVLLALCLALSIAPTQVWGQSGVHTIFGDFKVDTSKAQQAVPTMFFVILASSLNLNAQRRQPVSNGGRFRFINVSNGEYDLIVEVEGQEVAKTRIIIQSPTRNDFQHNIELEWRSVFNPKNSPGIVSALYPRTSAQQTRFEQALAAKKDVAKAIELFTQLLKADPKDFVAWTELGSLYFSSEKLDTAANSYQKALSEKPDFVVALVNLGKVQIVRKEFTDAISFLEKALALKTNSAEINFYLGEAYLGLKKGSKAVGYLNEALRLDPVGMAEAHLRLAALYNGAGYKDRAVAEYEQFLIKRPDYPDREKLKQYIKDNKKP